MSSDDLADFLESCYPERSASISRPQLVEATDRMFGVAGMAGVRIALGVEWRLTFWAEGPDSIWLELESESLHATREGPVADAARGCLMLADTGRLGARLH